jgi:de-etiolated-1
VRVEDGEICDRLVFPNDLMHLSRNTAVSLHGNLIMLLSIRRQCIHVVQVLTPGPNPLAHTRIPSAPECRHVQ